MAGEELIVRMGLDPAPFRQGMSENQRWLETANRQFDTMQKERAAAETQRIRENHQIAQTSFRMLSIAGVAAIGALSGAWDEYSKRSEAAARGMDRMRSAWADFKADIGRDTFGGAQTTVVEDAMTNLRGARRGVSDYFGSLWKSAGSMLPGGASPMSPVSAYRDIQEQDRLLRDDERLDQRGRAMGTMRRESVGFIADDRARAIEEAMLEAAEALKRIADDPNLDHGQKDQLTERIKAARDEQVRRLERRTFGSMDADIFGAQDEVAGYRSQLARASEDERIAIESRLAASMEKLAVLMATRAALDDTSLSDAEVEARIARAKIEARQERDLTEAGLFARDRDQRARRQEQERREAAEAADRARMTRTSVRDQLAEDQIDVLGASGNDLEARRLALALRYRQRQESIAARQDLSAEQRQALLKSAKTSFEAQFAALGNAQRQQTLGAGSGILAGDAFSGPGPMLNVQKSMDLSLKSIDRKMDQVGGGNWQ